MNQPKYSFGQKLLFGDYDEKSLCFEVKFIQKTNAWFLYSEDGDNFYAESHVELYQEPQKKKLYAWKYDNDCEIIFCLSGEDLGRSEFCRRVPEYDIEYPEEK